MARVGCSGWVYRDWRGVVYPEHLPQRAWFAHYADAASTPSRSTTPSTGSRRRRPSRRGPRRRRRASCTRVKLGQFGSHRMKLRDAATLAAEPPRPGRAARPAPRPEPGAAPAPLEAQRRAARRVPHRRARATMRWAVELRDPSWLHDDVFARARAPRRRAVHPRPAGRPSVGADHRLDLRPLPRAERPRARSTTAATAAAGCGGSPTGWPTWLDEGCRRLRLLQQRLRRPRGRRRPLAGRTGSTREPAPPPGSRARR